MPLADCPRHCSPGAGCQRRAPCVAGDAPIGHIGAYRCVDTGTWRRPTSPSAASRRSIRRDLLYPQRQPGQSFPDSTRADVTVRSGCP